MLLRSLKFLTIALCVVALTTVSHAQMNNAPANSGHMADDMPAPTKALPSPPATAEVQLDGKQITIHYNTPSMRGRKIMGGLVPYGKPWRTGANPATTLITKANLKIGTLDVPSRNLYPLHLAQSRSVAAHRQQEDRRVGHPLSGGQRPWPHSYDLRDPP